MQDDFIKYSMHVKKYISILFLKEIPKTKIKYSVIVCNGLKFCKL